MGLVFCYVRREQATAKTEADSFAWLRNDNEERAWNDNEDFWFSLARRVHGRGGGAPVVPRMLRKICSRVAGGGGVCGGDAGPEFLERALGDQLAALDDGDVGAETLDDFKHVRGEEDGGAAVNHALEHGFEGVGGDGVDAFEGLVEEEDAGRVDDGGGERRAFSACRGRSR